MATRRASDRRIQKTDRQLRDALHSLISEKPYEAIVVKEILHRANVGRSTFYSHFRDKDALLAHGLDDLFGEEGQSQRGVALKPSERVVGFSLPFFRHLERHRRSAKWPMGPSDQETLHDRLAHVLAARVASDLRQQTRSISGELVARYVAFTFILVLTWWVERMPGWSANEANDAFRDLVLPTLARLLD